MKLPSASALLIGVIALSGCYHATVTTGLTPGTTVIEENFAHGWVYGLVPPKTIDATSQCTGGVAVVETELSFVNQLVSALTFGIYTPMHIKVTCASGSSMSDAVEATDADVYIPQGATITQIQEAFSDAAALSARLDQQVVVRYE